MKNPLRFDEEPILIEQLRLLLGNVGSSVIPAFLLATLLFWVLSDDANRLSLFIWCVIVTLSKLNSLRLARRYLAADIPVAQLKGLVRTLIFINTFDGVLWGGLAWITLDTAGYTGSILVISVIGGVAGSAMSLLAPVFPAFVGFAVAELGMIVSKLWLTNEPAYGALAIAGIIYLVTLLVQGYNSSRAARSAIELRFENSHLLDQLRTEKELAEAARREAELANTAKSKFLAAASHDLRQPIHAQGLFLEALLRTELTSHQQQLLANARAASEASSELLNALLDFSRIEAGVIEPQPQAFRLQPLLNKIEKDLAPQADAKDIIYRSRETGLIVHSDPILLELILRNLVSNAIRYTQTGGVLVACRRRGSHALLEVWDTGIGIAPEHQQEVFREFYQLGNPERDRNKGLGLGLAIAEGLTRTLGYQLSLASKQSRGTVFRLHIPISTAVLPAEVNPHTQSRTRLLAARVLVIDDDKVVRDGMQHLLRDWGCECVVAETIEEACALALLHEPELIISDYRLRKNRHGVEAIAEIRALCGKSLPALLITGDTAPERLREAKASGIPLMHKPVLPSVLYRKLVEVLADANQTSGEAENTHTP